MLTVPVSVTLKKKVSVIPAKTDQRGMSMMMSPRCIPSVKAMATRKREKGGRFSLWFSVAKVTERMIYGATILKI